MHGVRFFRPEFWLVSVFPAWVGWALAARQFTPEEPLLLSAGFVDPVGWAFRHWRALLTIVTLGPFLGGSLMVTNDYYDRDADVFNPKKARSPLVLGTASPAEARAWIFGLSAATLLAGLVIAPWFAVFLAAGLVLSFAYSAPPVRLKARVMGDVLANTLGYAVGCAAAGWWLGGGAGRPFPWGAVFIISCAVAAGYIPSVMMDREADERAGLRTTAVTLGHRACWILGLLCLLAGNVVMAGLALERRYVPPSFVVIQLCFFLVEAFGYAFLVRKDEPSAIFAGACVVTLAFFGNLAAFLLVYTGALSA